MSGRDHFLQEGKRWKEEWKGKGEGEGEEVQGKDGGRERNESDLKVTKGSERSESEVKKWKGMRWKGEKGESERKIKIGGK